MATRKRDQYTNDPLDELLDKLNSGDFMDQSIHEFSEVINDTVKSYRKARTTRGKNYQKTTYSTIKPIIRADVETASFDSRHEQVLACLDNITYVGYGNEKKAGYQAALSRYRELVEKNPSYLKDLELDVNDDINTCQSKMRKQSLDSYTQGYYDALLMIKKILFNSKLARLRELSNKLKQ